MKLVDILARELKVWPADCDSVTQSKLHAEIHNTPNGRISESRKFLPGIFLNERHEDEGYPVVTRAEWQAAVDALDFDKCEHSYSNNIGCPECGELSAPKVVEWDGEGEPPVGIECEWHPNVHGWVKVKILGRDGSDTWYRASGEEHSQTCRNMAFFRPIRTAEQVAAEEREKAIKEMMQHGVDAGDGTIEYSCAALYDAGYRKEPKPCGF